MDILTQHRWHLQVNRSFRDAVLASPLIQHKIDLYATGLEYNAAAGISLADSREALLRYRSGLDSLRPVEERTVNLQRRFQCGASGGAYVIVNDSIRLFTLGSASRGIPPKEWEIPLPFTYPSGYGFYPGANVIAFVEGFEEKFVRSS